MTTPTSTRRPEIRAGHPALSRLIAFATSPRGPARPARLPRRRADHPRRPRRGQHPAARPTARVAAPVLAAVRPRPGGVVGAAVGRRGADADRRGCGWVAASSTAPATEYTMVATTGFWLAPLLSQRAGVQPRHLLLPGAGRTAARRLRPVRRRARSTIRTRCWTT